jgi:hypothetical protein
MTSSTGLWVLASPWVLAVLIVFGLGALEGERQWTRMRRQAAANPGPVAYAIDGLALAAAVLFAIGVVLLVARALLGLLQLVGAGVGWMGQRAADNPWALAIVTMVCLVGVGGAVLLRRRAGRARLAVLPVLGADARPAAPRAERADSAVGLPEERVAPAVADALDGVSMFQNRPRPAGGTTGHPRSFLDIPRADAPPASAPKRRPRVVPALVALLVVALVGGAVVYRAPLTELLAGATGGRVASATAGATAMPTGAALVESQPTALAAPTAAAPIQAATRHVKSDSLNLRAGPGTDQPVLAVLAKGDAVALLDDNQLVGDTTWIKVRAGDREGWVSEKLLDP